MDVAGAARILILGKRNSLRPALVTSHRADHLQIVRTEPLPGHAAVFVIPPAQYLIVSALFHERNCALVTGRVLGA